MAAAQRYDKVEHANKEFLNRHAWPHPAGRIKVNISSLIASSRDDAETLRARWHFTAILRTSQQIHSEAVEALYQQTVFRIFIGRKALESIDAKGKLRVRSRPMMNTGEDKGREVEKPLTDLSLFSKMQNVHLDLNFGSQSNPIWDTLSIMRAIVATLHPNRKHTTASLRFGLMAAITCARLPEGHSNRFVQELKNVKLGCIPDIEIDKDAESWAKDGRQRFEGLKDSLGGGMRFVKFEERLGPYDEGLRACVIL